MLHYVGEKLLNLKDLLQEHSEVFRSELGLMEEFKVKMVVKPDAKPIFVCPWAVPFALREPIKRELDFLEEMGMVEKITHSKWVASIVAVPKSDSTVRICRTTRRP